jgi:hypothetical protein
MANAKLLSGDDVWVLLYVNARTHARARAHTHTHTHTRVRLFVKLCIHTKSGALYAHIFYLHLSFTLAQVIDTDSNITVHMIYTLCVCVCVCECECVCVCVRVCMRMCVIYYFNLTDKCQKRPRKRPIKEQKRPTMTRWISFQWKPRIYCLEFRLQKIHSHAGLCSHTHEGGAR